MDDIKQKYKIYNIVGQYHSSLEHTFLWILESDDAHLIQKFCIDIGLAEFNTLKIIPMITASQIIENVKDIHK